MPEIYPAKAGYCSAFCPWNLKELQRRVASDSSTGFLHNLVEAKALVKTGGLLENIKVYYWHSLCVCVCLLLVKTRACLTQLFQGPKVGGIKHDFELALIVHTGNLDSNYLGMSAWPSCG